jgi:hypothetical protein
MNTTAFGVERGTLIRVPATENLMIDSKDRNSNDLTAWDFSLTRSQPLLNGFFTRVGTTEVVLEWGINNISTTLANNQFGITDSSGVSHTITLDNDEYTIKQAMDTICAELNALGIIGYNFTINAGTAGVSFNNTGASLRQFRINPGRLAAQLDLNQNNTPTALAVSYSLNAPDLRPYRYLDFTCEQLTMVQDVKDASTANIVRDVLCRWYFADEVPNQLDAYGFPILMGYTRFCQRRIFNPPKQIKWEQIQQVGGYLRFTVYGDDGTIVQDATPLVSNWLMTLQLTEG